MVRQKYVLVGGEEMKKLSLTYTMVAERKPDGELAEAATAPKTEDTISSGMLLKLGSASAQMLIELML
jgi:hypothetical protein